MVAVGVTLATAAGHAAAAGINPARVQAETPAAEEKKPESAHPPVQPAPAESRTPEEATKRAADPRDPSGALIIAPPIKPAPADSPRADR